MDGFLRPRAAGGNRQAPHKRAKPSGGGGEYVDCPLCSSSVPSSWINEHIDNGCVRSRAARREGTGDAPSFSFPPRSSRSARGEEATLKSSADGVNDGCAQPPQQQKQQQRQQQQRPSAAGRVGADLSSAVPELAAARLVEHSTVRGLFMAEATCSSGFANELVRELTASEGWIPAVGAYGAGKRLRLFLGAQPDYGVKGADGAADAQADVPPLLGQYARTLAGVIDEQCSRYPRGARQSPLDGCLVNRYLVGKQLLGWAGWRA